MFRPRISFWWSHWGIFVACIALVGCGPRYQKVKGQWAWVGINAAYGRYESIIGADVESFIILSDRRYGKDRSHVFYEGHKIIDADPDSFALISEKGSSVPYSKDRSHVFLYRYPVISADPDSFEIIDPPYARDRLRVYCGTVPMKDSDPATFQIVRHGRSIIGTYNKQHFIDLNGPDYTDLEISESHPVYTSNGSWTKDAKHHYRDAAIVKEADYETFHAIDNWRGADKDREYIKSFRKEEFERASKLRAEAANAKVEQHRKSLEAARKGEKK